MVTYYTLMTQMRVKGGNDYIDYIRSILDNSVENKIVFNKYDFKIVSSFERFEELLVEKENKSKLSRMITGYAWPWINKNVRTYLYITNPDLKKYLSEYIDVI